MNWFWSIIKGAGSRSLEPRSTGKRRRAHTWSDEVEAKGVRVHIDPPKGCMQIMETGRKEGNE